MAIKAGQILHDANGFTVDRIQTGGVSNLNIPEEKIYELGNYETVATVRDVADLTFEVESLDVSTEFEAILAGKAPSSISNGDGIDLHDSLPIDVVSPFKTSGAFSIVQGIAVPYLTLESCTYRFGVRQNSTQSFSLRGDSVYYTPGTPYYEEFTLVDNQLAYSFAHTALPYQEAGDTLYALSVCVKNATTKTHKRLFIGSDYTNTSTGITLLRDYFDEGYTKIHVVYATAAATSYTQEGNNPHGNLVHEGVSVKPAAVRGKDIDIYLTNPNSATPALERWSGVQSFEVTRRVNLEADEELGNYHYVSQDYDTADVTGSVTVRPESNEDLFDKVRQIANISSTSEVIGAYSSIPLEMELRVNDPDSGARLKTLYVKDARFTIPNTQGQVQQKLSVTFNFTSDGGSLVVYKGAR
jgi:hypothetical protein